MIRIEREPDGTRAVLLFDDGTEFQGWASRAGLTDAELVARAVKNYLEAAVNHFQFDTVYRRQLVEKNLRKWLETDSIAHGLRVQPWVIPSGRPTILARETKNGSCFEYSIIPFVPYDTSELCFRVLMRMNGRTWESAGCGSQGTYETACWALEAHGQIETAAIVDPEMLEIRHEKEAEQRKKEEVKERENEEIQEATERRRAYLESLDAKMKFYHGKKGVYQGEGIQPSEALIYGNLAIYRPMGGIISKSKLWTIGHIPTGLAVAQDLPNRMVARRILAAVLDFDWSFKTAAEMSDERLKRVPRIVQAISNYDMPLGDKP